MSGKSMVRKGESSRGFARPVAQRPTFLYGKNPLNMGETQAGFLRINATWPSKAFCSTLTTEEIPMKFAKNLLAAAALTASFAAGATVTGSLGGGSGTFLALSGPSGAPCTAATCTLGPGVATITGGRTYLVGNEFNDSPTGSGINVMGNFLSAGPTASEPSVMSFLNGGVNYISFLWGSPDLYNRLTVHSSVGVDQSFTAAGLSFAVTNGNQSFAQYVRFAATAGSILSLTFNNDPQINAFETANFSVTPVPEPETYALMLAGLGALGFISRRRKRV